MLFDELRAMQREHGYLPATELRLLSERMHVPLYRINGVAEFYPHFHTAPPPAVRAGVCADMACHLHGAEGLCAGLKQRFQGIPSKSLAIHEISCLGQCDAPLAIAVNDHIHTGVNLDTAASIVSMALAGMPAPEPLAAAAAPPFLKSDPYAGGERYGAFRKLLASRDLDGVYRGLKDAGLVGMGGAGFPAAIKWDAVRRAPGPEKFVVCNADESEPGTIKDRFILDHLPHLVIEGMLVAALATGAQKGYFYIRHEYDRQEKIVRAEIERCLAQGLLGRHILGSDFSFDLEVFVSPGGYICGEGSALLEALEGKRAEPRNKPPNSATQGLWQKPTVLNNVETFAIVPQILERGAGWYRAQGLNGAPGLKFVAVSGDVVRPGVFEIPMGTPAGEVILNLAGGPPGGKQVKAFSPSGAASGYLPASRLDVRLDFKSMREAGSMLGSGALVVVAEGRCMLDMALNPVRFFRNESCGKCVPCRIGSQKMVDILTGWTEGRGVLAELELIDELSEALRLTSICGLGQFVPYPILTALQYFRDEIEAHLVEKRCPEGVCPMRSAA